jgi:DNA-binding NtrC family response regulator
MVAAGSFRADLFYRLNVLPLRLPALRERMADLEALVETLAEDIARRSGLPHKGLTAEALDLLARQTWPGNIRELRNVLEQATLMTDDMVLDAVHFRGLMSGEPRTPVATERRMQPPAVAYAGTAANSAPAAIRPLPQAIAELEVRAIREAMAATGGNKLAASRLLGISRATLYEKLALIV